MSKSLSATVDKGNAIAFCFGDSAFVKMGEDRSGSGIFFKFRALSRLYECQTQTKVLTFFFKHTHICVLRITIILIIIVRN